MTEILSSQIGEEPIALGAESRKLDLYDGLQTPISNDVIVLTEEHRAAIEAYAIRAAGEYGDASGAPELTLSHATHQVPTLVARVDCTVNDGNIVPYEMEDSPSGQGITHTIHQSVAGTGIRNVIRNHYQETVGAIPHVIVSGARSHGTDDKLIVGEKRYVYNELSHTPGTNAPIIVKAIPGQPDSHRPYLHLQDQLVAPLVTEGDKSYAERMGDLTLVACASELLTDDSGELTAQVLKARLGSMAMGVSIYLDPGTRKILGRKGTVTAGRFKSDLEAYVKKGGALVQEFTPPIQIQNPEGRSNAILRVFTLLSRDTRNGDIQAQAIGGCYVARPELIIQGASNAVAGAVLVQ